MTIPKATQKKMEKAGVSMVQEGNDFVATWIAGDTTIRGSSMKQTERDIFALIDLKENYPSFKVTVNDDSTLDIYVRDTDIEVKGLRPEAARAQAVKMWEHSRSELDITDEEEDNEAEAEQQAAIEEETGEAESTGISVVKSNYRAIYKEQGRDGIGSGDWLDRYLTAECASDGKLDVPRFEAICAANGVDLSKYNRTTNGWQGRLRMTGRNMLAKKLATNGHLKLPYEVDGKTEIKPSDPEWTPFKKYAKAATLQEEAAAEANLNRTLPDDEFARSHAKPDDDATKLAAE